MIENIGRVGKVGKLVGLGIRPPVPSSHVLWLLSSSKLGGRQGCCQVGTSGRERGQTGQKCEVELHGVDRTPEKAIGGGG